MKTVAYYKGCLASLSAKELDTSTQALAPQVGLELIELEAVTCCGAGDIHEAEPDYYLHLNARILAYAEETGADTLMTICNVCTLNLRQANHALQNDAELLARVNENLVTVGAPPYSGGVAVMHFLMPAERLGVPWPVVSCPRGSIAGPCRITLYKDPRDPAARRDADALRTPEEARS